LKETNIDDPRSFKNEAWSSDVKNWPKVDLGHDQIRNFSNVISYMRGTCMHLWLTCTFSGGRVKTMNTTPIEERVEQASAGFLLS
jgi:hypothetical protein